MTAIGVNTWVWVSPLTDDDVDEIAPRVADWGFDVIELPVEGPDDWDAGLVRDRLDDLGLGATVCSVMGPGRSLVADDATVVEATQDYLRRCVDMAVTVGSDVVAGPMYAPTGETWLLDADERARVVARLVRSLRPLADYAGQRGVTLGIEPLNRYETSLVNTVEQAVEIVDAVDSPACGIAVDTFHLNIEEKDPAAAVGEAGERIVHVQACGNDRGAPGSGHFGWQAFASALANAGYSGPWCIESFTPDNRTIARAASIWRPLEQTQDAIATDGLGFLRGLLGTTTDRAHARTNEQGEHL